MTPSSTTTTTTTPCSQCYASQFEPNDRLDVAAPLPLGPWPNLAVATGDLDWYRVTLNPGQLATVEITFPLAQGDLDLTAYDTYGACQGGLVPPACTWSDRTWEAPSEVLSVVNSGTFAEEPAFLVAGYQGATNDYAISVSTTPWIDAAVCTTAFGAAECEGRPGGMMRLVQFPFPDPDDVSLGDAYRFLTPANYRWGRRELVMLIRHALRRTRAQFPGTKPLGIADISQRNGMTPGNDIGILRHPESSHDQGGNVDLAYFTTLARDGLVPYNDGHVICDAAGGSNDGSFCTAGAATSHVVDLQRQVYFLAQLFDHPRIRVIGVDRVIGPLLQAEAQRQRDLGLISQTARDRLTSLLASGDGWPFQFRVFHVSLAWWR